jgi:hypothetical protein
MVKKNQSQVVNNKTEGDKMDFILSLVPYVTFLGVAYLVYADTRG